MRLVKLGLISALGIFGVIFLLSLLIPSRSRISRAITINSPINTVKNYLADMHKWQDWNDFLKNEKLTSVEYDSNFFSSREMKVEIIDLGKNGEIQTKWKRIDQEPIWSGFAISEAGNSTVVQWYFDFSIKWYPWEKFGSIIFDKELGPPMESSLDHLKKTCEKAN